MVFLSTCVGILSSMQLSFWLFAVIVLVFSSGMMVMFLYMTSLCSEDKLSFKTTNLLLTSLGLMAVALLSHKTLGSPSHNSLSPWFLSLSPFLAMLICLYLLVSLFCVAKMAQGFKGSLMKNKF